MTTPDLFELLTKNLRCEKQLRDLEPVKEPSHALGPRSVCSSSVYNCIAKHLMQTNRT